MIAADVVLEAASDVPLVLELEMLVAWIALVDDWPISTLWDVVTPKPSPEVESVTDWPSPTARSSMDSPLEFEPSAPLSWLSDT
ncbi:hypothetical protein D3C87_1990180 [compost metagenome]